MARQCSIPNCERNTQKGELCFYHRPRVALKNRTRYIKPESDKARTARLNAREDWFIDHPPDTLNGKWWCYLNHLSSECWVLMDKEQIERHGLEHKVPKVKSRELKFDIGNLAVGCPPCNKLKGSHTLDQLRAKYPDWSGPLE